MDWWQILLIILASIIIGVGVGYLVSYLIITRILKKPFFAFSVMEREAVAVAEERQKSTTTPGLFTKLMKIPKTIGLKAEEPVKIETQEVREEATVAEEAPTPALPELFTELAQEQEREKAEQQARELAQREAEEAEKAREIEEQEREKAEQQARELAQREAEEAEKAREIEEQEREKAEQQARELAQREAEEAEKAREIEEQEREKAAVGEERLKIAASDLLAELENNRMIASEPQTGKLIPFQIHVWNTNPAELHTLPANLRENLTQAYSDIQLANSIVWLATELGRRSPNLDENYMKLCTNIATRLEMIIPRLKQSGNK